MLRLRFPAHLTFHTGLKWSPAFGVRSFAAKRGDNNNEEEIVVARRWLANFDPETIPRSICDISFSRSSGPGGQNVNKVSSKATVRISTSQLLPLLPNVLHQYILQSRYHAPKSGDIVIQADDSRKQTDNVNGCFRKLHELIESAGRDVVPGETSADQMQRVERLQKAEAAGRMKMKKKQSEKKGARRGGGKADY